MLSNFAHKLKPVDRLIAHVSDRSRLPPTGRQGAPALAAPLASAARYPSSAADSGLATNAVPSCAAAARGGKDGDNAGAASSVPNGYIVGTVLLSVRSLFVLRFRTI
jgi:hypothetical protein